MTIPKKVKRLLWPVGLLAVLWLAATLLVPMFIDHETIRKETERELSDAFGYSVSIRDSKASFPLRPRMEFQGVIVRNAPEATSDKLMAANSVTIDFDLLAFISGELKASRVTFHEAHFEVQRLQRDKLNIRFPKKIRGFISQRLMTPNITLQQSHINYTPLAAKAVYKLKSVNAELYVSGSGDIALEGVFFTNNQRFEIEADGKDQSSSAAQDVDVALDIRLSQEEDHISYQGTLGRKDESFFAKGVFATSISNVRGWMDVFDAYAREQKLFKLLKEDNALRGDVLLNYEGTGLTLATRNLTFNEAPMSAEMQMSFRDIVKFRASSTIEKLHILGEGREEYSVQHMNALLRKLLPANAAGTMELKVEEVIYQNIKGSDAFINATLLDEELIINQSAIDMAGDTQLLLFGILKGDANRNIHLDGNIELIGKDIQAFMTALALDEHKLLANHQGNFRAKSNLYLSAKLNTLSELRFQAGRFFMEGGVQYRPEPKEEGVNYVASLRVSGGNMDSLARYINPTLKGELLEGDFDTPKITLPWLDSMENTYRLIVVLEDFRLFDLQGSRSRLAVDIGPKKMGMSSVDLNLGDIKFTGDLNIDQTELIPVINADFYLSDFTVNSLVGKNFRKHPIERGNVLSVWEDDPLNVDFLKGYSGEFSMRFGTMHHDSFTAKDVQIEASSDEGIWKFNEFRAKLWGGNVLFKGGLDLTSIAAAKIDFRFKNIYLHELLSSMLNIDSIRGRININGSIDTGGISVNNLIDNMTANIVLAGNNIVIKGFDMAGLIQALPSVRSNSEIANTVRVSLIGGQTTFQSIEGAFYIANGILKTHGLTFRSKHAIGTMTGKANLVTWAMDYAILFRLPTLAVSNFPELTLYFRKSMDDPLIQVDTRALESFMTQRRLNR